MYSTCPDCNKRYHIGFTACPHCYPPERLRLEAIDRQLAQLHHERRELLARWHPHDAAHDTDQPAGASAPGVAVDAGASHG